MKFLQKYEIIEVLRDYYTDEDNQAANDKYFPDIIIKSKQIFTVLKKNNTCLIVKTE